MNFSSSSSNGSSRQVSSAALAGFVVGTSLTLLTTWLLHRRGGGGGGPDHAPETARRATTTTATTTATTNTTTTTTASLPAEIRHEQLSRHYLYFGPTGMERLQHARICVVGLGGVGSHTAHMLARAGVGYLRLIDFDQVSLSSLNRHACAVQSDVGTAKATCLERYLRRICPDPTWLQMDARVEMYTSESGPGLLDVSTITTASSSNNTNGSWDLVIDAIDDVPTKAALLAYCITNQIRVFSCMGAAGKADFTRLHCSDLRAAAKDPLATKLRNELKRLLANDTTTTTTTTTTNTIKEHYLDDMQAVTILYCSEKTVAKLADFTNEQKKQGVHQFGAVDGMRIRVLPVLGTMPAIMGQALATMALTEIGQQRITQPIGGERVSRHVRNRLWQHAKTREDKLTKQVLLLLQQQLATLVEGGSENKNKLPNENAAATTAATSIGQEGCYVSIPASTTHTNGDDKSGSNGNNHQTTSRTIWIGPLQIDNDDIEYLMQVWRNRCAVTGDRLGTVMHLIRWDLAKPSDCRNVVLVGANALHRYEASSSISDGSIMRGGKDFNLTSLIQQRIESRLATIYLED